MIGFLHTDVCSSIVLTNNNTEVDGGSMKGNVLIGQAGGPSAVINASLAGVIETAKELLGTDTIYGMRFGIEGFLEERLIDLNDISEERIERLKFTPGAALGSCRYKLLDDDLPKIRTLFEKYNIRYFFYIGGNDTMDTIERIEEYCRTSGYELTAVGVPKTVDNDLYATDHTPGYPSAARYVALSIRQGGRLAADMQRVDRFTIYQTIGRDAGWLAAASAFASKAPEDPPHLIYVPERRMNKERFLADVDNVITQLGWVSVVAGEGVVWEDGTPVSASMETDRFSNIEFGATAGSSAAISLHKIIKDEFGIRGEFQIPESLHMCADDRVSDIDRREAEEVGTEAARLASEGTSGVMVTITRTEGEKYEHSYSTSSLSEVAVHAKPMPEEYLKEGYVAPAFFDYLAPLIGEIPDYEKLV